MRYELEYELEAELESEFRELTDAGVWTGSPEQLRFREQVLNAHLARSRNRKGPPQPDLSRGQLRGVRGTKIEMRRDAAEAASQLLEAARAGLATAQAAGQPDAMRTVRLTSNSGHRSSDEQRKLWLRYFSNTDGYYNRTRSVRAKIPEGPHSPTAVSYMLDKFGIPNRIAAPGYSNHQGGIAIDFQQVRSKGQEIRNAYDAQGKWRSSWFLGWLKNNAARFGFKPYTKEAWHWEYKPGTTAVGATRGRAGEFENGARPAPRAYLGGYINTITLKTSPVRVSVFCPKAASMKREVDVLVYAHGLLGVCETPRPGKETEDIVTSAPFKLGQMVDSSKRAMVLLVPFFGRPWTTQGLGRPLNLNRLVNEALAEAGRMQGTAPPALANLILAGHSRAYSFLEPLASSYADPQMQQGALAKLSQVWAFDTTYACNINNWMRWLNSKPGLKVNVFFRKGTGTDACGQQFYKKMTGSGGRLMVTPVDPREKHCAVPVVRMAGLLKSPGASGSGETESGLTGQRIAPPRICRACGNQCTYN